MRNSKICLNFFFLLNLPYLFLSSPQNPKIHTQICDTNFYTRKKKNKINLCVENHLGTRFFKQTFCSVGNNKLKIIPITGASVD